MPVKKFTLEVDDDGTVMLVKETGGRQEVQYDPDTELSDAVTSALSELGW